MVLICDPDRQFCRGYDGTATLTLDPASFRSGNAVPGSPRPSGVASRPSRPAPKAGASRSSRHRLPTECVERWRWPLESSLALALLAALGAIAAMLVPAAMLRVVDRPRSPSWMWAIGILLRLVGLAAILLVTFYIAALDGLTSGLWLVGLGGGAALGLLWRSRRRRHAVP